LDVVAPELGWPVRVAGPTHSPDRGAEASSRSVELLGRIPHAHMIALMQEASIFVSPARYEPFGLTVLEAARCGCALVLADIPSLRELWEGAALCVHPEDTRELTDALLRLCKDETLRRGFQYAAHRQSTRYSVVEMADAYRALYDTLRLPQRSIARFHSPRLMELSA
jgi:glycosyltransferase involved in cell wall biosynthesis